VQAFAVDRPAGPGDEKGDPTRQSTRQSKIDGHVVGGQPVPTKA